MASAASAKLGDIVRAKKLDLGCFVNIKIIRDHTKRKTFEKYETERYVQLSLL